MGHEDAREGVRAHLQVAHPSGPEPRATRRSNPWSDSSTRLVPRRLIVVRLSDLDADGAHILDGLGGRIGCHARGQLEQHPRGKPASAASAAVARTQ